MDFVRSLYFIFCLSLFQNVVGQSDDLIVNSTVGLIRGLRSEDGQYSMFMGIPYASVNFSNPFGEASRYPNFEGIFEANDDSALCPQAYFFNNTLVGSLDCLHLNVFVPSSARPNDSLAVIVWIHGGAFRQGYSGRDLYSPDYFVRHNVIFVNMNYRLGPYGFMCLDIPDVPGNQGLKDQIIGLRWVRDNIEAFGGDVNRITLFGASATAHAIELHLRSPHERLYNNIIMQSGSAVAAPILHPPDKDAPIKLAERLGLSTNDVNEAIAFLTPLDPLLVVSTSLQLGISFRPCVERQFNGIENFINSNWIDGPVHKIENVTVLLGFNEYEMMFSHINEGAEYFERLNIFFNRLNQAFDFHDEVMQDMERIVRHFYIGDAPMSIDVKWPIINFDSDFTYIHPVHRTIRRFLEDGARDIYYYMFSYSGGKNFYKFFNNVTADGATHADELGYLFNMTYMPEIPTPADQLIIDRITTMWTNFAKYSNPTPERTSLLPITWTPLTAESYNYLRIDTVLSVGSRPFHERMAFWDLFYDMNKDSQRRFEPSAASGISSHLTMLLLAYIICIFI